MTDSSPPGGDSCSHGGCCGHTPGSCGFPVKYLALILVPIAGVFVYTALRPQSAPEGGMDLNRLQQRGADLAGQMDQYAAPPAGGTKPGEAGTPADQAGTKPQPKPGTTEKDGKKPEPAPK